MTPVPWRLGGLFAALSIATHTEFLAVVLGGLYVMEAMSDVIQVGYFKMTHKRVFKMAPIHHHFELKGWTETKVVVRFWMIELIFVLLALTIFYGDWVTRSGLCSFGRLRAQIWVDYAHPRTFLYPGGTMQVADKTVVIAGLGVSGTSLAEVLRERGAHVIGVDERKPEADLHSFDDVDWDHADIRHVVPGVQPPHPVRA